MVAAESLSKVSGACVGQSICRRYLLISKPNVKHGAQSNDNTEFSEQKTEIIVKNISNKTGGSLRACLAEHTARFYAFHLSVNMILPLDQSSDSLSEETIGWPEV